MSNSFVRITLETALRNFATANSLPVAWEDVAFTPPATGSYLEAFFIPAKTVDITTDGLRKRYTGIFQINICTRSGSGSATSEAIENQIIALFPLVPKTHLPVSIENTPYSMKITQNTNGFKKTAITVEYRMEA